MTTNVQEMFGSLLLDKKIVASLTAMGFEEPSPIQEQTIPLVLEGSDVIGQAQTGTGKTAAFGIPVVQSITDHRHIQALIMTPTRELAIQVAEEIGKIGRTSKIKALPVYGGQPIDRQIRALRSGVQIVIGTPGRLIDHINRKTIKLDHIKFLVLDEADEMLDMGFVDDMEEIMKNLPAERQTLLFSATMPRPILSLTKKYMKAPKNVTISKEELTVPLIDQYYFETKDKIEGLCRLLDAEIDGKLIIFCRTKKGVDDLAIALGSRGYMAEGLHGDLSQTQRDRVMKKFRDGTADILIATDVAARGIDIDNITHVINFDIPQDPKSYVHRIGRTGRAGNTGVAMTFITPREFRQLKLIERTTKTKITRRQLPTTANVIERQRERILDKQTSSSSLAVAAEKTILVGMDWGQIKGGWTAEDSLEELKQLADTAGAVVVNRFIQRRAKPDPAFFIGKGKVQELALYAQQENIDLCIFDDELTPAQQRNIEQVMGVRILDRTALILDIFAQRARTNEGKLQVELAQLQYNLPRIMGKGLILSRLGGGIGTRGPGETKLEVDRRRIRDRIAFIKDSIEKVRAVRTLHRIKRAKNQVPSISLVGYTNAGKSTLLNLLTQSDIYAKDQLFATLDPTTRQLILPDKHEAILTDTVGFIQRLPHQLVAAFRSTLEEVAEADLLLHVIDVSHELYQEQSDAVYKVLEQIGAQNKTILTVYNKIDKLPSENALAQRLAQQENSVCISAKSGIGIEELLALISENLKLKSIEVTLLIPYTESEKAAKLLHTIGTVLEQEYKENGTFMKVRLASEQLEDFEKFII